MISELDIGWLAGLLEGEGSFRYYHSQQIDLNMTDEDVVERYARITGELTESKVNIVVRNDSKANKKHKVVFRVTISGERARIVMRTIVGHMGWRRRQRIWQSLNKYIPKRKKTLQECGINVVDLGKQRIA